MTVDVTKRTAPGCLLDLVQHLRDAVIDLGPVGRLALVERLLQSMTVVQSQRQCLTDGTQPAVRKRMFGHAFHLERSTIADTDQQSAASGTAGAGRGELPCFAGNKSFRLICERNRIFDGGLLHPCSARSENEKPAASMNRRRLMSTRSPSVNSGPTGADQQLAARPLKRVCVLCAGVLMLIFQLMMTDGTIG